MLTIKVTIYYESPYWVGSFERMDQSKFQIARHIFGAEPSDSEVHEFVLNHFDRLKFGKKREFELIIKRKNPKRVLREVKREMERLKETSRPSTHAQDAMREELEMNKMEKKKRSRDKKEAYFKEQFEKKQQKRKEKRKGR